MTTLRPPPSSSELAELVQLHRLGRYLDAFHFAQRFSAPESWTDIGAVVLAGRLLTCWGDWTRSNRLHHRAWRAAPDNLEAIYYAALTLEHKHGPFEALRFLREQERIVSAAPPSAPQAWLWLHEARLLGTFRDFDAAELLVQQAERISADDPWFWVERSRLRLQQDRHDEAMSDAERGLALGSDYRPAIEALAHLLMLENRDAEALTLLQGAVQRLQAANLAQMLANLLLELERPEEALTALARAEEWSPCAEPVLKRWLAGRRADAWRALGRDAEAAEHARRAEHGFHEHVAKRLSEPAPDAAPRVHLRVDFVRQHHMTCAPATLAAIGRFWRQPIDHLELARTICYDGTPDHEERHWAENHGWLVREFRITWESATALLRRGCPFTLTTVSTRSAHLQAIVGCDERLGLLLIRDPYQRTHGECIGEAFLSGNASHGPRGMVLVPREQAGLVADLDLPEAALYDEFYRLRRALVRHDRAAAQAAADALQAAAPDGRLAWSARRELAFYDGNQLRQIEATRGLLKLFPDDANLLLDEVQLLRGTGQIAEWRERVTALARRRPVDPIFLREWVEMLGDDARNHPRALREARRILRRHAVEAGNLRAFANLLWARQEFAPATDVYRLAACVAEKNEKHWHSFFVASRHTQQVERCLELLRQREARLGAQSGQPVRTLFRAYETLDRTSEGFAALDAALARLPDDGELQLFAAESQGRFGRVSEASRWLAAATDRVPRMLWLRTSARLAEYQTDFATALARWRELLDLNPTDSAAHTASANLIATLEGRPAALAFLRDACARHPDQTALHHTLIGWLRSEPAEEALVAVERMIALDPLDAWAWREKAIVLRRLLRLDDALAAADEACRIEPHSAFSIAVRGTVLHALGRSDEARAAYEAALRRDIDCGYIDEWLAISRDFAQRQNAIALMHAELLRQPVPDGGTILKYREVARGVLPPVELQANLERIRQTHDANWGAWSALIAHLLDQGERDAALARAREATERFPLVPRAWLDLATVQSHAPQADDEIASLQRALELSPAWGQASRALAQAHERALQLDAAEHTLRRAIAADPLDAASHAWLADLLWRRGRQADALTLIERALTLEPAYDWAWQQLDAWSFKRGEPARATALAETITRARPADPRAWLRLARAQAREPAVALASVDRALAATPASVDALDLRAQLLCALERYDEALAACRPAAFGESPPLELLGRAAGILQRRGEATRAIAELRKVVEAHPDFRWGWSMLTEWLFDAGQFVPAADAARKWTWLAPDNAVAFGYAAAAEQRMGNRREAKNFYGRALHCDPAYGFGAHQLLQLLAEDRDLEEAKRVLRHIETHLSAAEARLATVKYHIFGRDRAAAGQALAPLAFEPDAQIHFLQDAAAALAEAGWNSVTEETLAPILAAPNFNPAAARVWVGAWPEGPQWRRFFRLARLTAPEPVRIAAWAEAIERLGRTRATWRLRWHRWRRGDWLRRDIAAWGSFGYALTSARLDRAMLAWAHDWRERADASPWMLHNLVLACYRRRQPGRACEVIDHALALKPDQTLARFRNWRGLESLLRGDAAAAAASLAQTDQPAKSDFLRSERALLRLLVDFENGSAKDARYVRLKIKELWSNSAFGHGDTAFAQFFSRALRHVGRRSGSTLITLQSYLPLPGRLYTQAPPSTRNSSTDRSGWYLIWIACLALSGIARSCHGS